MKKKPSEVKELTDRLYVDYYRRNHNLEKLQSDHFNHVCPFTPTINDHQNFALSNENFYTRNQEWLKSQQEKKTK